MNSQSAMLTADLQTSLREVLPSELAGVTGGNFVAAGGVRVIDGISVYFPPFIPWTVTGPPTNP